MPVDLSPRDGRDGPVCRNHGIHCGMGRTWPAPEPKPTHQDVLIWELIWAAREAKGQVRPTPEFTWATAPHVKVPRRELEAQRAETRAHLARAQQDNAEKLARIRARHEENRRAR